MAATITWQIQWMSVKPTEGQYTDVVVTAGWICSGVQTEGDQTYNGSVYSTCSFPEPANPDGQFTPYPDLTEQQVLGWCWANGVDQASAEAAVQQQIDNQINPPVVQPPLPWAQSGVTPLPHSSGACLECLNERPEN